MSGKCDFPEELRMRAYYFGFSETGWRPVDEVLSAVAQAGKGYHHTESWNDSDPGERSYAEEIQMAATRAAEAAQKLVDCEAERIRIELLYAIEQSEWTVPLPGSAKVFPASVVRGAIERICLKEEK